MSGIFVGVYWRARAADVTSCADLTLRHFEALAAASPNLARWYQRTNRKPKKPIEVDVRSNAVLQSLLLEGLNCTDVPRKPIPELGWRISLWNGDLAGRSAVTSVHCGLYSQNPNLSNVAYISIEGDVPNELAIELLRALVEIWNPDRGVAERTRGDVEPEATLATYTTSAGARLFGGGERVGRGRLIIG